MLKKILYTLALLFVLVVLGYRLADEPVPKGEVGPRAEYLADKMLTALNYNAWQNLGAIAWSYPRGHDYIWDKHANLVSVKWDDFTVLLNPENKQGIVYEGEKEITGENQREYLNKAFEYFVNDSFWLIAPFKARDPGTTRKVVKYKSNDALLVQYNSGGVTPGDSYLWILNDDGMPVAWKFWASIVPVGGLKFTWENWENASGAKISTFHDGLLDIEITNLRWSDNVINLNNGIDPFSKLR